MQIKYGHALQHVVYSDWPQTIAFLFVAPIAAWVQTLCWIIDEETWKTTRLCEQERVCNSTLLEATCSNFEVAIDRIFLLEGAASVCMFIKGVSILMFAHSHAQSNTQVTSLFDLLTIERAYDGCALWCTCLFFDVVGIVATAYRHGIFLLATHASELYPESADDTGWGLFVCTWASAAVGTAATLWAFIRLLRVIELAHQQGTMASQDEETNGLINTFEDPYLL